ncbi:MAG TPA: C25 family cysteine peptidase, partial [Candidatus Cloacimonadota bacterium]|nr:C25 family cysteine peptidase [Candidatus Cloacimonadota bacterium]
LTHNNGGSDPSFSLVAGSDNYPDIFIGRFSAETAAQVTAQINKAIAYERDVTTSDTWLSRALGIASDEGGSGGDNGESDIAHMNNIRTDLLNYGYTSVDQIYDPGASASTVTTNVNAGRGFMNYVGHGSNTSWVTTGFNNTNASALTNGTKTPFIMDVACVNGNFVSITCFAEAWLRNANGGAVAMYASSINQSWSSPMRAQDEVTDLLVAEAKTTVGGLYYNGSCEMMDAYGSDGVNMFKTWHIFGDASLSSRTKTPIAMNVTHPSSITSGTTSVNVSTGVNNTLVAITYNNVIYGRAFTNSSGNATITLSNPPTGTLNYTITATAHNRVTYVGTIAQTVSAGPWMEVTAANYDDANNDIPEYNESGYFDVTFKNSGTSAASGVTAILSCSTSGITITDNSHTISSLAAGASVQANDAYAITIANNVPDGTVANFTITMTMSGYDPWTYNFSKTINAPALAFGNMTISDPTGDNDGLLDPGETATISIVLNNSGGAASLAGSGTLTCSTSGITVVNGSASFTAISAGGYATLNFTVTAASSMAEGTLAAFVFNAVAGQYSANTTVNVEVGAPMEVIIGNGTSTQSYPIDRYYNYSSHEAIYLTSEIGTAGTIKSIGFYKASGADVNPIESVTVYMKNTSSNTLADGTYSTTGYTQVYSGTWPNTATSGWMEVNLDNQFAYDGSNLSILTIKGNQAWTSNYPVWTYTTASPARARQSRNDNYQPTSLTASTNLPNLKLKIFPTPGMLYPPRELTASATHGSVTLTWQAPMEGTPTGYKVYKNNTALTTVTGLTYTDTAVTDGTTYSYKVTALYGSDESDPTATVTATPNMYAPTNLVATGGDSVVMLTWTAAAGREAEEAFSLGSKDRAISSYRIYRDGAALTTVTGTSYSDTNVTNGTTYNYYVTTLYTNPAGESAASNTASATPNIVTEVIIGTGTGSNGTSTACP